MRAELGLEKLASRWEKLRLGYWRRIQAAKSDRALAIVAAGEGEIAMRGRSGAELDEANEGAPEREGPGGVLDDTQSNYYHRQGRVADKVYEQVEEYYEQERERQCATMPSVARYLGMKCWDRMSSDRAVMKGEVGMRGALVVERYLDDVQERLGLAVCQ